MSTQELAGRYTVSVELVVFVTVQLGSAVCMDVVCRPEVDMAEGR